MKSGLLGRVSISEDATIRDAMEVIDRGAIEIALMVSASGRLVGTITDGDIRRALLAGADLDGPVAPYVQRSFTSVGPEAGRAEVLDLMRARVLRQILVVDADGCLLGLHLLREMLGASERLNWAVIMAGGRGMRLRPITDSIPKPMVPVAGRPILERLVLHLVGQGFNRVFLSVNYRAEIIERHFGNGEAFGCRIEYLREESPLGTGGSLSLLPERPKEPLMVMNGDLLTDVDLGGMLSFHERGGYMATVGLREYVHTVPFGVASVQENRIQRLEEKPTQTWRTNCGIYVLDPSLVERVPQNSVVQLPELIEDCLDRGEAVGAYTIEDDWMDVGRPDELSRARGEDVSQ